VSRISSDLALIPYIKSISGVIRYQRTRVRHLFHCRVEVRYRRISSIVVIRETHRDVVEKCQWDGLFRRTQGGPNTTRYSRAGSRQRMRTTARVRFPPSPTTEAGTVLRAARISPGRRCRFRLGDFLMAMIDHGNAAVLHAGMSTPRAVKTNEWLATDCISGVSTDGFAEIPNWFRKRLWGFGNGGFTGTVSISPDGNRSNTLEMCHA
jgi:hypothetical protein